MKRLSLYLFLIFFTLQTSSWADDIRDFQIEGMSVGDSLLDYYNEEKINSNLGDIYKDKKFSVTLISDLQSYESYERVQIHFKTDDKKYIIHAIDGMIDINIDECLKRLKKIDKEFSILFKNTEKNGPTTYKHYHDETGKSKVTSIFYVFKPENSEEKDVFVHSTAEVSCYDFAKHMNYSDGLTVALSSEEFTVWLENTEKQY